MGKDKEEKQKAEEAKEKAAHLRAVRAKRQSNSDNRDKRVKKKQDDLVKRALDILPQLKALEKQKEENNKAYLQKWNEKRRPAFEGVRERIEERQRVAEKESAE